jgi:ribosome-associated translation inhibitor RaiA
MQLTTTFRDMPTSPALQAAVERWAARLEQVSDRIVGCHVCVEKPHRHHLHGSAFLIHVALAVPGGHIDVSNQRNANPYAALADAFRAARRQLVSHLGLQRHFVRARGSLVTAGAW